LSLLSLILRTHTHLWNRITPIIMPLIPIYGMSFIDPIIEV